MQCWSYRPNLLHLSIHERSLESWRECSKAADNKSVDAIHERSAPSWRHLSKAANNKSVDARLVLSTEHCSGLIDRLFVVLSTDSLTDPNTASPFQVVLSTNFSISATVTQKSSTCNFCTIECRNSQRFT